MNLFPFIPLSISILFAFKLTFIYLLALYYGHVKPFYPFISDSGATHPEAAYFSILLFIEAFLMALMGWIRFKQIRYVCNQNNSELENNNKTIDENHKKQLLVWNQYGLYASLVLMLGMSVVGAFRSTEHLEIHLGIGAYPAFIGAIIYFSIQTRLSYEFIPTLNSLLMARFRFLCTVLALLFGVLMTLAVILSWFSLKVSYDQIRGPMRLLWDESYGGYVAHCFSTIFENVMIFMICPFYASFVKEFKNLETHNGILKYKFVKNTQNTRI